MIKILFVGLKNQKQVIVNDIKGKCIHKCVKNYFASWNEYSRDESLPIDATLLKPN